MIDRLIWLTERCSSPFSDRSGCRNDTTGHPPRPHPSRPPSLGQVRLVGGSDVHPHSYGCLSRHGFCHRRMFRWFNADQHFGRRRRALARGTIGRCLCRRNGERASCLALDPGLRIPLTDQLHLVDVSLLTDGASRVDGDPGHQGVGWQRRTRPRSARSRSIRWTCRRKRMVLRGADQQGPRSHRFSVKAWPPTGRRNPSRCARRPRRC